MVSRILEIHPAATEEADAATDWYARRSLFAARAFVSELIHAVDQVAEEPERWPFFEDDTRRYVFPKFPFSLIYRIRQEKIQIIAVMHSKRKPGYWKKR